MADKIKVEIGKNLIEILTEGMYLNPLFMYREYVQNSADAIDDAVEDGILKNIRDGKIMIDIHNNGSIYIQDNGTGIKAKDVTKKLYNIAKSDKDHKVKKGFRGIGRLGGIAYCDKMKFITSAKGEKKKSVLNKILIVINEKAVRFFF